MPKPPLMQCATPMKQNQGTNARQQKSFCLRQNLLPQITQIYTDKTQVYLISITLILAIMFFAKQKTIRGNLCN